MKEGMRLIHTIAVLGGDARQRYLSELLSRAQFSVRTFGVPGLPDNAPSAMEAASQADAVCLPTPAVASGAITGLPDLTPAQLLSALTPDTVVFGGGLGAFRSLLQKTNTPYYDMLQNPALALSNASVTAEGAILLALQAMPITLQDATVLVTGFGRIGKSLAGKLRALGARVALTSRSPKNFPTIEQLSCTPDETGVYRLGLSQYDAVFNTVPAPVFSSAQLAALRPDCPYIELASSPGGIAPDAAKPALYIPAPGLPGKTAPKTAAALLLRAMCDSPYLSRQEVL